ncbi:unnamed protein product [Staurois parvus]|uniref:Uncharacterized protein n=1 Tax=Staurois parvus TaxID=386267 RepID=A0ABN9GDM7_9NEOB|nr:unnamed protein product [Staurois parvus]
MSQTPSSPEIKRALEESPETNIDNESAPPPHAQQLLDLIDIRLFLPCISYKHCCICFLYNGK